MPFVNGFLVAYFINSAFNLSLPTARKLAKLSGMDLWVLTNGLKGYLSYISRDIHADFTMRRSK